MKQLVIFGTEDLAAIAHEYFIYAGYDVSGFTVDREYLKYKEFCGLPVVPFDEVETHFPPETHEIFVAIVYQDLNRLRQRKCKEAKDKRYDLASYISPHAFVSPSADLGEHHFIMEMNVIQPFVTLGDNCILWSGNHIGHHSKIGNNVFISSHVVVSGHCDIGDNCFLGVNATIPNATRIGKESWVMHGAAIPSDIPDHSMVSNVKGQTSPLNESALNRALLRAKK